MENAEGDAHVDTVRPVDLSNVWVWLWLSARAAGQWPAKGTSRQAGSQAARQGRRDQALAPTRH